MATAKIAHIHPGCQHGDAAAGNRHRLTARGLSWARGGIILRSEARGRRGRVARSPVRSATVRTVTVALRAGRSAGDPARRGGDARPRADLGVRCRRRLGVAGPAAGTSGARHAVLLGDVHRVPFGLSIEYPLLERALGPAPARTRAREHPPQNSARRPCGWGRHAGPRRPHGGLPLLHSPSFFTTLGCLARETGAQVTVGLNLGDGTVNDARTMVAEAQASIPASQLSFSIGNEPDLYTVSHPLWSEPGFVVRHFGVRPGRSRHTRASGRGGGRCSGPIRVEGPDLATGRWAAQVGRMLRADPPYQMNAHLYPTVASGPNASATAAAPALPLLRSRTDQPARLAARRRTRGAPSRGHLREQQRIARGQARPLGFAGRQRLGRPIRTGALLHGYQQVFFHSAGVSYDPFVFNADGSLTPGRSPARCRSFTGGSRSGAG